MRNSNPCSKKRLELPPNWRMHTCTHAHTHTHTRTLTLACEGDPTPSRAVSVRLVHVYGLRCLATLGFSTPQRPLWVPLLRRLSRPPEPAAHAPQTPRDARLFVCTRAPIPRHAKLQRQKYPNKSEYPVSIETEIKVNCLMGVLFL